MELAERMTTASREAFEERLASHRALVFKVAHTYCRDPDDRADLAQEIAAQLWRAWPSYRADHAFSTWMYRVALNTAISFVRGNARRHRHFVPLDEAVHDVADGGHGDGEDRRIATLQRFIARQGAIDRALLLLYLDGRSHREIGDVLGLSETNVSTKIGRLKQRIRDAQ
mgnify:CR=1 FL=1